MDQLTGVPSVNDTDMGEILSMMRAGQGQVSAGSYNQQTPNNSQGFPNFPMGDSFPALNSPHPDGVHTPSPVDNRGFPNNNQFCLNVTNDDDTEAEDQSNEDYGSPTTSPRRLFFLCPYYMFDPVRYHSCRDHHHDQFSRVKQHIFRSHLNWCKNCHQDFSTKTALLAHNSHDCIKSFQKPPGYCDDELYKAKLSQRMSVSTDLDRYNEMVQVIFKCKLPADTDISFPYPVIIEEFTEVARDRLSLSSLSSIMMPIMNARGQPCFDAASLESIRVQILETIGLQHGQQEIRRQIVETKKPPRMSTARDRSPGIRALPRHASPFTQRNGPISNRRAVSAQPPMARPRQRKYSNTLNVNNRVTKAGSASPYTPSLQAEQAMVAQLRSPITMAAPSMPPSPYSISIPQPFDNPEFNDHLLFPPTTTPARRLYPSLQIPTQPHVSGNQTCPTLPTTPQSPFLAMPPQNQMNFTEGYGHSASSPVPTRNLTVESPVVVVTSQYPYSPNGINPNDAHMGGF